MFDFKLGFLMQSWNITVCLTLYLLTMLKVSAKQALYQHAYLVEFLQQVAI
jgi:hypothetical protein